MLLIISSVRTTDSNTSIMIMTPTFPVVEVEFDGLALVDVQVGEPHGGGEQNQQQQELELLPDLLHREAQHPDSNILRYLQPRMSELVAAAEFSCSYKDRPNKRHWKNTPGGVRKTWHLSASHCAASTKWQQQHGRHIIRSESGPLCGGGHCSSMPPGFSFHLRKVWLANGTSFQQAAGKRLRVLYPTNRK